jgi:hypothetical protein
VQRREEAMATQRLWRITISSLFPNDHRVETVYEGRHESEEAAREAALAKEGVDHGWSTIATVTGAEAI